MSVRRAMDEGERKIARQSENKPDFNGDHTKRKTENLMVKNQAVKKINKSYMESLKCASLANRNKIFD